MAETVTKTVVFPALLSAEINQAAGHDDNSYSNMISDQTGSDTTSIVVLEANFNPGYSANLFFPATKTNLIVTKAELEYWHYQADLDEPIKSLDFIAVDTAFILSGPPNYGNLYIAVDGAATALASQTIHGIGREKATVDLGSTICTTFTTRIQSAVAADHIFNIGIRRTAQSSTERGTVYIGGPTLLSGVGSGWEQSDSDEISSPANLIITYTNEEDEALSIFYFRYTTEDPTVTAGQATPRNSIGSWMATNEVYTKTTVNSGTSPGATTISLDSSAAVTEESTGLAQIGPEIVKFGGFNQSSRQLSSVTRSIIPSTATTFGLEPFKDTVRYLLVSDLFDTGPADVLEQYRCIVVAHESSDDNYVEKVKIYLVQNTSSDVIIDVGIEVPLFDARTGTFASLLETGDVTFTSNDISGSISTGLFEDAHIVIDTAGTPKYAMVSSFDVTGSTGEFIIDRSMSTDIAIGTSFRINPAPSQRIVNDSTSPTENSGRFFGFMSEGGSNEVGYGDIRENNDRMNNFDVFYLWLKRTLTDNVNLSDDTGAIVVVEYDESVRA